MKKKIKTALISVSDKSNLKPLLNILKKNKIKIISSGGTYREIKRLKFNCLEVSDFTNSPEILEGRVKTLHPKIFGGLLGTTSRGHQKELQSEKIVNFDMLIINLYPFEETIKKTNKSNEIIEMIDIGGHSLIRAAIKNFTKTTPVVSPTDYKQIIRKLPNSNIEKKKYAIKALQHITQYDIAIANWFHETS